MKLSAPIFRLKRQAKLLAREAGIPLHKVLDQLARQEGFRSWSHLAASAVGRSPARKMLAQLSPGDLVLLGARPGHGKTLLGMELAVEAARTGRRGFFFTLEYNDADVIEHFRSLGVDPDAVAGSLTLDTSDDICAEYIAGRLADARGHAVAVIDYLQLLDQKRRHPDIGAQVAQLRALAASSGYIIVAISQIDRSFDPAAKRLPDLSDVRLPNPFDLSLFTKTCFLHEGEIQLEAIA